GSGARRGISPAAGRRSPASWPMSVVLPAPLGPMIACVSLRVTSRSIRSVASRPPKRLVSPRIDSKASAIVRLGADHQAEETALGEQDDQNQDRPENDLPVRGQRREHVLQQQERDGADHGGAEATQ